MQRAEFKWILHELLSLEGQVIQDEAQYSAYKKRINQTLLQCNWFDKIKTQYCLAAPTPTPV